jgi:NAD(P)-dependent dehydrogenase (short-subunit alcohol dehydrogenase family)
MSAPRAVLITGASTGIGAACAAFLAAQGYRVYTGWRQIPEQASLSSLIQPVQLDVCSESDWQAVTALIAQAEPEQGLYALINNAGIGLGGPIEYLPVERFRTQFEVNYFAVIQAIQSCLPLLRRGQPGRIINISSVNGKIVTPFLSPYCSSKFALEALTEALRLELSPWKIHCSLIEPGVIRTPIFEKAQVQFKDLKTVLPEQAFKDYADVFVSFEKVLGNIGTRGTEPESVARSVAKVLAANSPRLRYPVGNDAHIAMLLRKILPDRAIEFLLRKFSVAKKSA